MGGAAHEALAGWRRHGPLLWQAQCLAFWRAVTPSLICACIDSVHLLNVCRPPDQQALAKTCQELRQAGKCLVVRVDS